jgi:hypothetical protein
MINEVPFLFGALLSIKWIGKSDKNDKQNAKSKKYFV